MTLSRGAFVAAIFSWVALAACNSGARLGATGDGGSTGLDGFIDPGMTTATDFAGVDLPPVDSVIWAHTADTLYTVDPKTFALTPVGTFGTTDAMTDLAVTPDGKVYTISKTSVYSVDPNTANATMLATGIASSNVALTFRLDGTLLAADQDGNVIVIDPTNGSTTALGTYGTGYDTAGDLVAIADGTMYGVSTKAPSLGSSTNVLITVDTTTAQATSVGKIGYESVFGVAYSGGRVLAFTSKGQIIQIDPATGVGTLVATHTGVAFYGAGTSPLAQIQ